MKNAYLNIALFLDFIYIQYKKNKNILLIKQRKDEKKKIIKYIESQYIPFNLLKMKIQLKRQIRRKKQDVLKWKRGKNRWKEGEKKKMN